MNSLSGVQKVVFDFDNTLFDTEKKKHRLYKMAKIHGYSHQQAREIYKQARSESRRIIMSLSSYIKVLKERVHADGQDFKSEEVSEIITKMEQGDGLLPYAAELLKYCKRCNLDAYVLSLGLKSWQEEKVEQSGIKKFLPEENILYTDSLEEGKQKVLRELFGKSYDGENSVFFNDKPDETAEILADFPKLSAFVRREKRDDRYKKEDFEKLIDKYPDRVTYSQKLEVLMNKFKESYENQQHQRRSSHTSSR